MRRRIESDSQTRVDGFRNGGVGGVLRGDDTADERQFAIRMGDVHAVADDKNVGTDKADEIGADFDRPFAGLLQHRADENPPRAARGQKILGEGQRPARFENIVDKQNVAVADRGFDVAKDLHRPARHGPAQIARQVEELDLRLEPHPMQGAQQVGREHERPFEDRDDKQVLRLRRCDLARERFRSFGDRPFVVEDLDLSFAAHEGDSVNEPLSPGAANFTRTSRTPAGGAANRARNGTRSRGAKAGLRSPRRPDVKLAPVLAAQRQAKIRHERFPVAQIRNLACDHELPLAFRSAASRSRGRRRSRDRED